MQPPTVATNILVKAEVAAAGVIIVKIQISIVANNNIFTNVCILYIHIYYLFYFPSELFF